MPWNLDNAHTRIGFSVKHMMVSTVRGEFKSYTGKLNLDTEDFTRSTVEGEIEVASIDTNNADRDNHLRSGDLFDVAQFPKILFKSTRIERKGDDEYTVHGELTMRGVTKEISLEVETSGVHKNPWGQTVTGFSATGTINRKDFGMEWNAALETGGVLVSDKVKLELDVEVALLEAPVAAV